jgi:hypothetical protein
MIRRSPLRIALDVRVVMSYLDAIMARRAARGKNPASSLKALPFPALIIISLNKYYR